MPPLQGGHNGGGFNEKSLKLLKSFIKEVTALAEHPDKADTAEAVCT